MPIRILDAATVGRIAAGEVVERPSSVVKELMENSIDAGATSITVEIKGGGIDYLRVTDNGCGIEPGQVRLAFENHATSKLQSAEQLDDIRTLGFRGEALPSIASVSHVEMTTRARNQQTGMKLNIDGGEKLRVQETGCPEGTTFIMKDLFYNLPVRRAFLKKPAYEGGLVADTVARIMLGNPDISIRFINNGTNVYHSFGDGKLRHAVFSVYGKATAEQMVELNASEGGTRIYGLIGVGELAKSTRAHQAFFINGRVVRCATLTRALEEVCRTRVTIGMYPMCALNVVLPPSSVNVNVHPNKLEVRFKDEILMRQVAERLMARAFEGERVLQLGPDQPAGRSLERVATVREITPEPLAQSPTVPEKAKPRNEAEPDKAAESPVKPAVSEAPQEEKPAAKVPQPAPQDAFRIAMDDAMRNVSGADDSTLHERPAWQAAPLPQAPRMPEPAPEAEVRAAPREKPVQVAMQDIDAPASTAGAPLQKPAEYRVIGVLMKTYILIEAADSLVMIDQHAAHERLNYERLMAQLEAGRGSQQLLTPMIVRLTAREMALVKENLDVLSDAGYSVEPFGEQDIQVRAVPFILGKADLKPAFMDAIGALNRVRLATVDLRRAEIMQMSCKAAIKGGDPLSQGEIESLVRQLLETGAPPTCPHGRPVMKAISRREMEKMFKRIQ